MLGGFGVIGLAELALWAVGYGPPNRLFLLDKTAGSYTANPEVTHRFFPPHLRRRPVALDFAARKPPDTVRIFALGGSTLVGFPNAPGLDFPRFLQLMLADAFPDRRFEVVNCGITAVNSHCVLDFGREVLDYEPDLLVVYMGHNEFVGPYGPTTPFVRLGQRRPLIRAHMQLQRSRLLHGAKEVFFGLSSLAGGEPPRFGLHLVTGEIDWTDASYGSTVDNYRANLDDLAQAAADRGVPVLLGTLASNLGGFYPLRSDCGGGLAGPELAAAADDLLRQGRPERVRSLARESLRSDPYCAAAHFELARLQRMEGRDREAQASFALARDQDRVPFRAPSVFNEVVRETGRRHANVIVADVEAALAAASPGGIVGDELMTDYLHPTVYGHYLLARTLIEQMAGRPPASAWGTPRPADGFESCRDRLGYTRFADALARNDLIYFLRSMPYLSPPPLLRERVAGLVRQQLDLYARLTPVDRERFRRAGGLAFLRKAVSFAPPRRIPDLDAALRRLGA